MYTCIYTYTYIYIRIHIYLYTCTCIRTYLHCVASAVTCSARLTGGAVYIYVDIPIPIYTDSSSDSASHTHSEMPLSGLCALERCGLACCGRHSVPRCAPGAGEKPVAFCRTLVLFSQKENSRNCVWVAGGLSSCECVC